MKSLWQKIVGFFTSLFGMLFGSKSEKIRNKNAFKQGGYAVALIALVLAALVVLNLLIGLLNKRVNLEFDMTAEKKNSISAENRAFLKDVEKDVTVYFLTASAEDYYGGYMNYYAQQQMYSADTSDYYKQTVKLLQEYESINHHIQVEYVDPFGTEMSKLNTEYPNNYYYGDLLVVSSFTGQDGREHNNNRLLTFTDYYAFSDKSGAAAYGYDYYYLSGSELETCLTSAIASVTSEDTRKIGLITGHGGSEAFGYANELLSINNFQIEEIDDNLLTAIDPSFDALVICAPAKDFLGSELDALNDYLDNDGKKNKLLLIYGDTTQQNLPNFYEFLSEWGIGVDTGIVFETTDNYHVDGDYATFVSIAAADDNQIVPSGKVYLSGYNLPIYENGKAYGGRETETLLTTLGTSVVAPMGTAKDQKVEGKAETFATCVSSTESTYVDNVLATSTVLMYSSVDFIAEDYVVGRASYADFKDLLLRSLQVPTGMNRQTVTFEKKTIESTSELYVSSSAATARVKGIFTAMVPLAALAVGFVVFYRRKNR